MHKLVGNFLQKCLQNGDVPEWITLEFMALIIKYPAKGRQPEHYQSITCYPIKWRTQMGILADRPEGYLSDQKNREVASFMWLARGYCITQNRALTTQYNC